MRKLRDATAGTRSPDRAHRARTARAHSDSVLFRKRFRKTATLPKSTKDVPIDREIRRRASRRRETTPRDTPEP